MTKYLCDRPDYVWEYYEILDRICCADSEKDFDICEGLIERFYQKYGTRVRGFWWFTWQSLDKAVHAAYESLVAQLDIHKNHVYRMNSFENIPE